MTRPKLRTYATPVEVARLKKLRQASGLTQTLAGAALYTPRRTWQTWEDGEARMHRIIWQEAMSLLEAAQQRAASEGEAQANRAALGLPPLEP